MMYPKAVTPASVVNANFAPGLFRIKGGWTVYDEVYMSDGGQAVYLACVESTDQGLKVTKRWIPWDTELEQMFDPES